MAMSREAKQRLGYWLGIVVAVLTIAAVARSAVDERFVRKSAYRLDQAGYRTDQVRDSAWKATQHAITIDILCSPRVDPRNQRCLR